MCATGLGTGILLDATVVRGQLLPALVSFLGGPRRVVPPTFMGTRRTVQPLAVTARSSAREPRMMVARSRPSSSLAQR
jgi:uncharacterized membrane protein YdfJ with MMPL/SSD domain